MAGLSSSLFFAIQFAAALWVVGAVAHRLKRGREMVRLTAPVGPGFASAKRRVARKRDEA